MRQLLTSSHVWIYTIRLQYISLSPRRGTVLKKWSRWNRQGKRLDSTDKKGKSTRSPSIIADRIDGRGSRSEAIKPSYKVRSESLAPLAVPWRRLSLPQPRPLVWNGILYDSEQRMSVYGYMDAWPDGLPGLRESGWLSFPLVIGSVRGIIHLLDGRCMAGGPSPSRVRGIQVC